jgi:nucleoside-diphosphate-sugar epimerase
MSTEIFYALLGGQDTPIPYTAFPYMVDVRDAAEAHYQAIVRGAQGRFCLSGGRERPPSSTRFEAPMLILSAYSFQQVVDYLHEAYPDQAHRVTVGKPGQYDYKDPGVYGYDSTKSQRELGIKCKSLGPRDLVCLGLIPIDRSFEVTMSDAFDRFLELEKMGLK